MQLLGTGRCSTFGGPADDGVGPVEGLALIEKADLREWWYYRLFGDQPHLTSGLARRLNPEAFYIAMRWGYGHNPATGVPGDVLPGWTREQVRRALFKVSCGPRFVYAQAADWGPDERTGRLVDLSPGTGLSLGAATDTLVSVSLVP